MSYRGESICVKLHHDNCVMNFTTEANYDHGQHRSWFVATKRFTKCWAKVMTAKAVGWLAG